jgi:hypothetical protein
VGFGGAGMRARAYVGSALLLSTMYRVGPSSPNEMLGEDGLHCSANAAPSAMVAVDLCVCLCVCVMGSLEKGDRSLFFYFLQSKMSFLQTDFVVSLMICLLFWSSFFRFGLSRVTVW